MVCRKQLSNAIRILSIDAIQRAQSGHPGAPMGMADIAEVLWRDFLKHNPINPSWPNRDRFILSNGHASMLLYSLLHLSGYNVTIEDIKKFRQCHSKTPGHPEIHCTPGVEITTGPLGQGLSSGIGMAIAEKILSTYFNRKNFNIVDHYTWIFVGDGCLMEGISHESCSLAGTLNLGKLIVFYDKNGISIDGNVSNWFTDDTVKRFQSYNWQVIEINGHNSKEISNAINQSKENLLQPSIIICNTTIGFGSPNKSGKSIAHGAPLGEHEILLTRKKLNWLYPAFFIPDEIYNAWDGKIKGAEHEKNWNKMFKKYSIIYSDLAKEYTRRLKGILPSCLDLEIKRFLTVLQKPLNNISTRQASKNTIEMLGKIVPELLGGSADLAPSNLTMWSGSQSIKDSFSGNYIHYGVREFGMTSIANGIFHYGLFIPYSATFLVFVDYARNAVRMAALMRTQHIFIYTHDSIGVGEDGPTHQPVEHIVSLRNTPNLSVWRPCDALETAVSWHIALQRKAGPTALILSRQNIPQFFRTSEQIKNIYRGGYIIKEFGKKIDLIIIATGSEVQLAMNVAKKLYKDHYSIRVISMVSTDYFDNQPLEYRESILPKSIVKRVSIEAGLTNYWYKYVGDKHGLRFGIDTFGESGASQDLFNLFGLTEDKILLHIKNYILNT
ncbi:transketolase [Buchnera aphidicola (Cinara tujafilina)]|uniref:Transketolase n=1 Tax=Buchnera aphidicola (Cinara tujafilina) TaxID=261317 RepID=F7WZ01_9GAMM|nr:transketolase [Buchnera aphidicola]AEH39651.1 transketolase [Buchnera aphidicola (Cinara tujafilina)]